MGSGEETHGKWRSTTLTARTARTTLTTLATLTTLTTLTARTARTALTTLATLTTLTGPWGRAALGAATHAQRRRVGSRGRGLGDVTSQRRDPRHARGEGL